MKNTLIRKVILVGSALLIGIGICVSVWFFLTRSKGRPLQVQNAPASPNKEIPTEKGRKFPHPSQNLDENPEEASLTKEQRIARHAKSFTMSMYGEDQLATPEMQKKLEIMDSPEYHEMLKTLSTRNFADFWESKGFPVPRGVDRQIFSRKYPGKPEDYESEMRIEVAKLFLAAEPVDLADPVAAAMQRVEVYNELDTDDWMSTWYAARFEEDWDGIFLWMRADMKNNPALVWMSDVQRNAASIVANAEVSGVLGTRQSEAASVWTMTDTPDSSLDRAPSNKIEVPTMSDTEIVAEIEKSLTSQPREVLPDERPDTPSEIQSNLETTLKSRFSSERFERAMSTLEQYGPEEGLRRLRENDPEVAKQIENSRRAGVEQQRSREEDSQ